MRHRDLKTLPGTQGRSAGLSKEPSSLEEKPWLGSRQWDWRHRLEIWVCSYGRRRAPSPGWGTSCRGSGEVLPPRGHAGCTARGQEWRAGSAICELTWILRENWNGVQVETQANEVWVTTAPLVVIGQGVNHGGESTMVGKVPWWGKSGLSRNLCARFHLCISVPSPSF